MRESYMIRECLLPNWNLKHQRQEQVEREEGSKASHVDYQQNNLDHHPVPMSNYDIAGQLSHELGGLLPTTFHEKPTWNEAHDTLESIVQQATCQNQKSSSIVASSGQKRCEDSGQPQTVLTSTRKRARSYSNYCGRNFRPSSNIWEECDLSSGCASARATFCSDNDSTMMTRASMEFGPSLKSKILDEDSPCHCGSEIRDNQNQDKDTTTKIGHSNSTKGKHAATIHNQSERRRRDRINQKMKALQRLVPNSSKTDKASMLDEVINYLKHLEAQIQMMSNMRSMPQMMIMPLALQQQIHMSTMLARMGVGCGMGNGMFSINNMPYYPKLIRPTPIGTPATAPTFITPFFTMPSLIQAHNAHLATPKPEPPSAGANNASIPLPQQSINMDLLHKISNPRKEHKG